MKAMKTAVTRRGIVRFACVCVCVCSWCVFLVCVCVCVVCAWCVCVWCHVRRAERFASSPCAYCTRFVCSHPVTKRPLKANSRRQRHQPQSRWPSIGEFEKCRLWIELEDHTHLEGMNLVPKTEICVDENGQILKRPRPIATFNNPCGCVCF